MKYEVIHVEEYWCVVRKDGARAEFGDRETAENAVAMLIAGELEEDELLWDERPEATNA